MRYAYFLEDVEIISPPEIPVNDLRAGGAIKKMMLNATIPCKCGERAEVVQWAGQVKIYCTHCGKASHWHRAIQVAVAEWEPTPAAE